MSHDPTWDTYESFCNTIDKYKNANIPLHKIDKRIAIFVSSIDKKNHIAKWINSTDERDYTLFMDLVNIGCLKSAKKLLRVYGLQCEPHYVTNSHVCALSIACVRGYSSYILKFITKFGLPKQNLFYIRDNYYTTLLISSILHMPSDLIVASLLLYDYFDECKPYYVDSCGRSAYQLLEILYNNTNDVALKDDIDEMMKKIASK